MPSRHRAEEFFRKFETLGSRDGKGKVAVASKELRELVREYPEESVAAARAYLAAGAEDPKLYQFAIGLAGVYELEFDDDSLSRLVNRELKKAGVDIEAVGPGVQPDPDAAPPAPPSLVHFTVDAGSLASGDVYSIVRLFSVNAHPPGSNALAAARGKLLVSFPLDADPREIRDIPEVRRFIATLFDRLPYFPFFLHPAPQLAMGLMFFGSLVPADAWGDDGALSLVHPEVVDAVAASLREAARVCGALGVTPEAAADQILSLFPADYGEWFRAEVDWGQ